MRRKRRKSGSLKRRLSALRDMIADEFECLNDDLAEATGLLHDVKDELQSKPAGASMALATDIPADLRRLSAADQAGFNAIKAAWTNDQGLQVAWASASASIRRCFIREVLLGPVS